LTETDVSFSSNVRMPEVSAPQPVRLLHFPPQASAESEPPFPVNVTAKKTAEKSVYLRVCRHQ
jgi:hypothetical protein